MTFEPKKIDLQENTTAVIDLDCGTSNPDVGKDLCVVRDKDDNGLGEDLEKPSAITLSLGDTLTDEIVSTQGDKLDVGAVMPGDDGDGTYYILVSDDEDPTKTDKIYFSGDVEAGGDFTAEGIDGKFGSETFVHIFSSDGGTLLQTINFHTSCSAPLVIGDQYGSVSLAGAALEGKDTGTIYQIGTDGAAGDDGVTYAILGGADADLFEVDPATGEVSFKEAPDFEDPKDADGDNKYDVTIRATRDDGSFEDKPLEICVEDDPSDDPICIEENTTAVIDLDIAVACPKDEGLDLCAAREDIGGKGKPAQISLVYDPDASGVNTQGDKAKVTGAGDDDDDAFVIVSDKDGNTLFSGNVTKGDPIVFGPADGDDTLDSQTFIDIYDSEGGVLVQTINLHTSCSAPLVIGESFGTVVLAGGGFNTDGGLVTFGGTFDDTDVTYSIAGGADADLFTVDAVTGEVSFKEAPDFEDPKDAGGDNFYDVVVRATSNADPDCFEEKPLRVEVKDVPELGALRGRVFCDENDDSLDNGEPGVAGVTVDLFTSDGIPVATTTTDADGEYRFEDLIPGDYVVRFDEATAGGKVLVDQDVDGNVSDDIDSDADPDTGRTGPVTVVAGETTEDVDAGVEDPGTASLAGRVFCDENDNDVDDAEPGIGGVRVQLLNADGIAIDETTTAPDGSYEFTGLDAGTYSVDFDEADADLGGKVLVLPDQGDDDTIDSDASQADGTTDQVTLGIGERVEDIDAGVEDPGTAAIRGRYFCDENDNDVDDAEPGIVGAKVFLLDAAGLVVGETMTDDDGNYAFEGLDAGTYSVRFAADATGKTFVARDDPDGNGNDTNDSDVDPATGETGPITVGVGDVSEDNDAGVEDPGTASLGDTVFFDANRNGVRDGGEAGVAGVIVTLTGAGADGVIGTADDTTATDTTDGAGQYLFDGLDAGDYKVTFDASATGLDFTTEGAAADDAVNDDSDADPISGMTDVVTLSIGEAERDIDAGLVDPGDAIIRGRVFCDENDNSLDDDEPGVEKVTVTLLTAAGVFVAATETLADGSYEFTGLDAGDYKVAFDITDPDLAGKVLVTQNVDGDVSDDVDSDADETTGQTGTISLAVGEVSEDNDAGVEDPGTARLGDTVFVDVNRNGIQDAGDLVLAGVAVVLTDAAGLPIAGVPAQLTGADGKYLFDGLDAGDYRVRFDIDTDVFMFTGQNAGGDDALDSDADPVSGLSDAVTLDIGETDLTVDAGVISKDPDAMDDAAKTCADETVMVDVLDNDTDAPGETLTVTQVNGTDIAEGGTVVVDGVGVTLSGGKLVFDGIAEFAGLTIGAQEIRTISYTVEDGLGGEAMADVEVTFCGALNTLETIDASLPDTIQFLVRDVATIPEFIDLYTIELFGSGDARLDGLVIEEAYCLDATLPFADTILTSGTVSVATEANALAAGLSAAAADNIDLVNWILNEEFGTIDNGDGTGDTYTDLEIQEAIWTLLNGDTFFINDPDFPGVAIDDLDGVREPGELGTLENVDEIVTAALASGEGFEAGAGDLVGLILDPVDPETQEQPFIIAVGFDDLAQDCICI